MHPLKSVILCAFAVITSQVIVNAQPSIQIISPQDQAFVNASGGGPDLVDVTWLVTGNGCPGVRGTFTITPYVNGNPVACSGGCGCDGSTETCDNVSKTLTLDGGSFGGCLNTIQLKMSTPSGCLPNCIFPCSSAPDPSNAIQVWQDPFRTCTGPTDCNKSKVGEPIDVATGKMYHEMTDFKVQGPLPIIFNRRYDSQSTYNGPMGFGWQHSYSMRLESAGTNREFLVDAHGRRIYFAKDATGAWQENRIDHLTAC